MDVCFGLWFLSLFGGFVTSAQGLVEKEFKKKPAKTGQNQKNNYMLNIVSNNASSDAVVNKVNYK